MWNHVRSCAGVSLIETMIAVFVLAVGVLSLARLFTVSSSVLERARQSSTGAILASQKLEELRATAARGGLAEGVEFLDARGSATAGIAAAAFTRHWSIRPMPADPDRLRLLQVRVAPGGGDDGDSGVGRPRHRVAEASLMTIAVLEGP